MQEACVYNFVDDNLWCPNEDNFRAVKDFSKEEFQTPNRLVFEIGMVLKWGKLYNLLKNKDT